MPACSLPNSGLAASNHPHAVGPSPATVRVTPSGVVSRIAMLLQSAHHRLPVPGCTAPQMGKFIATAAPTPLVNACAPLPARGNSTQPLSGQPLLEAAGEGAGEGEGVGEPLGEAPGDGLGDTVGSGQSKRRSVYMSNTNVTPPPRATATGRPSAPTPFSPSSYASAPVPATVVTARVSSARALKRLFPQSAMSSTPEELSSAMPRGVLNCALVPTWSYHPAMPLPPRVPTVALLPNTARMRWEPPSAKYSVPLPYSMASPPIWPKRASESAPSPKPHAPPPQGGYLASGGVQRSQLAAIAKVEGAYCSVRGATVERI